MQLLCEQTAAEIRGHRNDTYYNQSQANCNDQIMNLMIETVKYLEIKWCANKCCHANDLRSKQKYFDDKYWLLEQGKICGIHESSDR